MFRFYLKLFLENQKLKNQLFVLLEISTPEISVFSSLVASQHFETYKRRVNIMILFRNRELFVSKLQKKRKEKHRQKKITIMSYLSQGLTNVCFKQMIQLLKKTLAKFLSSFKWLLINSFYLSNISKEWRLIWSQCTALDNFLLAQKDHDWSSLYEPQVLILRLNSCLSLCSSLSLG